MRAFRQVAAVSIRLLRDTGPATAYCAVCGVGLRIRQSEAEERHKYLAGLIPFGLVQALSIRRDGMDLCISLKRCDECGHKNAIGESWPLLSNKDSEHAL